MLQNFSFSFEGGTDPESQEVARNPLAKNKLNAFLSTPKFIKSLTDISKTLSFMQGSKQQKKDHLIKNLVKLN